MLFIQNSSPQTSIPIPPIASIKNELGQDACRYISDERLEFMLMMTKGSIRDTVLMAFGYIIQHLDLMARSDKTMSAKYVIEMEHYRNKLQSYLKR